MVDAGIEDERITAPEMEDGVHDSNLTSRCSLAEKEEEQSTGKEHEKIPKIHDGEDCAIGDQRLPAHLTITKSLEAAPKRQIAIIVFVSLVQMIQMYPYSIGICTGISIATSFYNGDPHSTQVDPRSAHREIMGNAAWLAASYNVTQGAFVLIGGRLGEIYGHKRLLMIACAWWLVWEFAAGFAPNVIALCVFRGLSGVGGGLMTPNCVALLGITFPPGKKRNVAFGLFGAMAPVGAAGGCMFAALLGQLTEWKWEFFFPYALQVPYTRNQMLTDTGRTLVGAVIFSGALLSLPWDSPQDQHGSIDYFGAYLGVGGLILFNFVWK